MLPLHNIQSVDQFNALAITVLILLSMTCIYMHTENLKKGQGVPEHHQCSGSSGRSVDATHLLSMTAQRVIGARLSSLL